MVITAGNLSESQNALDLARTDGKQNTFIRLSVVLLNLQLLCINDKFSNHFQDLKLFFGGGRGVLLTIKYTMK